MSSGHDVVICGASFAGIELARWVAMRGEGGLRVAVVDRVRQHGYLPLVHERLTGRLPLETSRVETAAYVESLWGFTFVQGVVSGVDPGARRVHLADGRVLRGRQLVLALGSSLAPPPGLDGAGHLWRYKTEADLLRAREALRRVCTGSTVPRLVVIGGGLSGVELAAELGALGRAAPAGWRAPAVTLLTRGQALLPGLTPRAGRLAHRVLRELGVDVRLGSAVSRIAPDGVAFADLATGAEHERDADGVFWSGGIRPAPVLAGLELGHTRGGWLEVDPYLRAQGPGGGPMPGVWACGDAVRVVEHGEPWSTMQRAIECLWQARVVAWNVLAALDRPGALPPERHVLRRDFPHGVSLGPRSLVVVGPLVWDRPRFGRWLRRFLMRRYQSRYRPRAPGAGLDRER